MAKIGAAHPCFCPTGAPEGYILSELAAANITPNYAAADLYGDNRMVVYVSMFVNATIAAEVTDMSLKQFALLYGADYDPAGDGVVKSSDADEAPEGGFGFYSVGYNTASQKKYYEAVYYPRAVAVRGAENAQTGTNSPNFRTDSFTLNVMMPYDRVWEERARFDTEDEAIQWVDDKCNIPAVPVA